MSKASRSNKLRRPILALMFAVLMVLLGVPCVQRTHRAYRAVQGASALRELRDIIAAVTPDPCQEPRRDCASSEAYSRVLIEAGIVTPGQLISPHSGKPFTFVIADESMLGDGNVDTRLPVAYEPLTEDIHCANVMYVDGHIDCEPHESYEAVMARLRRAMGDK